MCIREQYRTKGSNQYDIVGSKVIYSWIFAYRSDVFDSIRSENVDRSGKKTNNADYRRDDVLSTEDH